MISYSFKKARPKSLFKKDTKFWLAFVGISVGILVGLQIALVIKSKMIMDNIKTTRIEKDNLIKKTEMTIEEYETLKEHVAYAASINNSDTVLRESMKNLFEIVPDKITLSKVEMTTTTLSIFGTTPSRDIFNLQFAPALKSIFTKSETSFVRGDSGNSRFISINYIEQKDDESTADTAVVEPKEALSSKERKSTGKKGH